MIEAVVQTGPFETLYRRAGAGSSVLLVGPAEAEASDWLFGRLAGRFRTIAPDLPSGLDGRFGPDSPGYGDELEAWLRGLIDGLGLQRPALVAEAAHGAGLLRFVALDPERVGRVALLHPIPRGALAPVEVILGSDTPEAPHAVLVMGLPGPEDPEGRAAAGDRLVRFLTVPP